MFVCVSVSYGRLLRLLSGRRSRRVVLVVQAAQLVVHVSALRVCALLMQALGIFFKKHINFFN